MKNKICSMILALTLSAAFILGGCGSDTADSDAKTAEAADENGSVDEAESSETGDEVKVSEATDADGSSEEDDTPEISHYITIEVEDYGTIKAGLIESEAPETVKNFVKLAESGFYDGLTFHRIMSGFMIQGGDPLGNGTGGSDETIKGEFYTNGVENRLPHVRGALSMARSNDPDSASSQFFIVHKDSTFLDGQYAAFGEVTDGMDVVDKIATDAKPVDGNGTIPSSKQPVINSVTIERAQ
jgi:peptidyl-prolyl cis-trans isomerase B (cyclophilin B)